jgi:hypothetical protein
MIDNYFTTRIIDAMTEIYAKYCLPRITIDRKTFEITYSLEWVSPTAHQLFDRYCELLSFERARLDYLEKMQRDYCLKSDKRDV